MCSRYLGFVLLILFPGMLHVIYYGVIPNGVLVQVNSMFLKYQCKDFYSQMGSDTVLCQSDGNWSRLPICRAASCVVDPAQFVRSDVLVSKIEYLTEGQKKYFPCIWTWDPHESLVQCTNGRLTVSPCCRPHERQRSGCS